MSHEVDSIIRIASAISANTTVDSAANIDIPEDGLIVAIDGIIYSTSAATPTSTADQFLMAELSFLSTNQMDVNDARGSIIQIVTSYIVGGAASASMTGVSRTIQLSAPIPVLAGERIHVHTSSNLANLTGQATFSLFLNLKGGGRRAPKRR